MPGPAPKRPQNRSRQPRGAALTVAGASKARIARPEPPADILPRVGELWKAFWASPLAEQVIDSDRGALLRLFGWYDERERYLEEGRKDVLVHGSTGQTVLNPLLKQVDVLDAKILTLEDRFGLSPMARLKLQVTLGDASRSLAEVNAALATLPSVEEDERPDPRIVSIAR